MLVCVFFCASCTRDRGCSAHPAFPAPSHREGQRPNLGHSCRENAKPRLFPRHCEEPLRRSNPFLLLRGSMDCFAEPVIRRRFAPTGWLAMTRKERATFSASSPANASDPVHGFSALSLTSLEYWIARSSRAKTTERLLERCIKLRQSSRVAPATKRGAVDCFAWLAVTCYPSPI